VPEVRFADRRAIQEFHLHESGLRFYNLENYRRRLLSRDEFETLVRDKQTEPLGGFRSKKGKRFHAALKLSDDFKAEFDFGPNGQENGAAQPWIFHAGTLGNMSEVRGRVFESGMTYVCENSVGPNKTCDFRSGKVILQRPIEREQMNKLLASGKTDLLERFISRKGRPFKAFLVLNDKKDVGFEFEKRDPKAKKERKPKEPALKLISQEKSRSANVQYPAEKFLKLRRVTFASIHRPIESLANSSSAKRSSGARFRKNRRKSFSPRKNRSSRGFISKRGRPFSAYLKLEDGKVGFEFPEKTASTTESK
jgi:hypothetical protein